MVGNRALDDPGAFGVERMIPPGEEDRWSATQIHALGEMAPHRRRYVDLDPDSIDVLGRPIPRIHVAWSAAEKRMAEDMRRASVRIADALATRGSKLVPFVDPLQPGAGHEAGTCAMGADESAPCNAWGRLRCAENVWIADASALPTSGDRHPTLTLIAHALRTAHDVVKALRRTSSKR
jgi:choline dehydrogenase-like flavoprotein